jgi:hypothetical protein
MATTFVDQITGGGETVAQKAPVRLASTGNITLSGHQTIDGSMTVANDRVLVRANTDTKQNGIYIAAAGVWKRARDFDSNRDVAKGTLVIVTDGATLAGKEFQITSANPIVVGTSAITWVESLASDAGSAAAAAAASASSAATSATNAGNSATAAAGSASTASTAATNASNSASTAGTAATNAGNSATAAGNSATTASTAATNAGNSATAAGNSASAASTSAGNAATSATNAGNSATAAAASATAAATAVAALSYAFSTTTTDADPGPGVFRLNHATHASATAAYIDNADADAVTVTGILDSWDDAAASVRGTLTIRSKANPAVQRTYNVTGSVVDGTGYRKLTLVYVGGNGTLSNTTPCWLIFMRGGNDGAGDVAGPATTTMNGFVRWNSTNGTLVKDNAATLVTADVGDNQITFAKLAQMAIGILGRAANSTGDLALIAASTNDRILARVGNVLDWVQITIGMIPDALITYAKMAAAAIASAAELRAGTASKLIDAATVHSSMAWVTITAGSAPAIDHAAGVNRFITHSANAAFGAPSNTKPGMPLNIDITPGAFTTSWHANYKFGSAGAPSITSRKVAHFHCRDATTYIFLGLSDPT